MIFRICKESSVKILELIKLNSHITASELSHKLGISTRVIANHVKTLKNENILERVGADNGGY